MLESELETFICVAECGSFYKASEELYLSPNAVKKRINHIEEATGLRLFERSKKGVLLTKAGETFYPDAKKLLQSYKTAVERAKRIQETDSSIMKIGFMGTFADEFMLDRWFDVRRSLASFGKIRIVFFGSAAEGISPMLACLGSDIDIAVDTYDKEVAAKAGVLAASISSSKIACGIPESHRLSGRTKIAFADLSGETVIMLRKGINSTWDKVRAELLEKCPGVKIEDIEEISIRNINICETENKIILLSNNWKDLISFVGIIPLECDITMDFGFYYPKKAPKKIRNFIDIVKNVPNK